ncbi:GNAT family N-acetyltransferase [Deefgea rivuli]|uniref:GNAT family N-acetyltransferase n=1 Tax=Deefgea rivuli TaxID=400948 RepID=UPI00048382FA|nr:GNAT family N-acetyltransferase [Deefgea rivuli]
MADIIEFKTDRLIARQWRDEDAEAFAQMNADPRVMQYFPACLSRDKSDAAFEAMRSIITEQGWGFWAIEEQATQRFIGFVGLNIPSPELPFSPCTEIGWRLAHEFWGKGYATEAAQGALRCGFTQLNLAEIVSFTSIHNQPSQAVMRRLGMLQETENFQHPKVLLGHELREHCLYRLSKARWAVNAKA